MIFLDNKKMWKTLRGWKKSSVRRKEIHIFWVWKGRRRTEGWCKRRNTQLKSKYLWWASPSFSGVDLERRQVVMFTSGWETWLNNNSRVLTVSWNKECDQGLKNFQCAQSTKHREHWQAEILREPIWKSHNIQKCGQQWQIPGRCSPVMGAECVRSRYEALILLHCSLRSKGHQTSPDQQRPAEFRGYLVDQKVATLGSGLSVHGEEGRGKTWAPKHLLKAGGCIQRYDVNWKESWCYELLTCALRSPSYS